jgi:RNA polymerase sigma factor (sigma-70 family)
MTEELKFVELDNGDRSESEDDELEGRIRSRVVFPPDRLYEEQDNPVDQEIVAPTFNWMEFCRVELSMFLQHHQLELPNDFSINEVLTGAVDLFIELAITENRYDLKIPVRAMLRLCLKKVLFYQYKLNFELDGSPKKYFDNNGKGFSDCLNENDQKVRNARLREAQMQARTDVDLCLEIVDLVQMSLLLKMLPEMFRRDAFQNVQAEQLNDLTVNFLIWTLHNNTVFRNEHLLLIYFSLFKCANGEEVFAEMEKLSLVKERSQIKRLYEEIEIAFSTNGRSLLQKFLDSAELACGRGLGVIMSMSNRCVFAGEYSMLKPKVIIPSSPLEDNLRNIDCVLAQHGNFTARNNFVLTLLPFFLTTVRKLSKGRGRLMDLYHDVIVQALNKVIKFDVRKGFSPTTYFYRWAQQMVSRSLWQDRAVYLPDYLRLVINHLDQTEGRGEEKTLSDEKAIVDSEKKSVCVVDEIVRGLAGVGRTYSIDAPLNDETDTTFGSLRSELSSREFSGRIVEKDFMERVAAVFSELPRFDAEILGRRFGMKDELDETEETLLEISRHVGVTRERIRQIQESMLRKIQTGRGNIITVDESDLSKGKFVYQVEDLNGMRRWAVRKGLTEEETEWLSWSFCGNEKRLFRAMTARDIADFLGVADDGDKFRIIERCLRKWAIRIKAGVDVCDPEYDFIQVIDRNAVFRKMRNLLDDYSSDSGDIRKRTDGKPQTVKKLETELNSAEGDLVPLLEVEESVQDDVTTEALHLADKFNFPKDQAVLFYQEVCRLVDSLDPLQAMVLRWGLLKGESAEQIAVKLGEQLISVHVMLGTAEIYLQELMTNLQISDSE